MSHFDYTIRPATADDMEAVWAMWKEIMDQKVHYPYDECLGHDRAYIQGTLGTEHCDLSSCLSMNNE
jgi:hypothetical protein